MRAIVLGGLALVAVAAVAIAGCDSKVRSCKSGTVLVTIDVPAGSEQLAVDVSIDGNAAATQTVTLPAGMLHGSVELDFSRYPAGSSMQRHGDGDRRRRHAGAATSNAKTLAAGCDAITLAIVGGGDGLAAGGGDLAGSDGSVSNSGCSTAADCPKGQACDTVNGVCTTACSASQACNGGCCDGATCVAGSDASKCALGK